MHTTRRAVLIGSSATGAALISPWALADPLLPYRWQPAGTETLAARFPAPAGFQRVAAAPVALPPGCADCLSNRRAHLCCFTTGRRSSGRMCTPPSSTSTSVRAICSSAPTPPCACAPVAVRHEPAGRDCLQRHGLRSADRLLALGRRGATASIGPLASWSRGAAPDAGYASFPPLHGYGLHLGRHPLAGARGSPPRRWPTSLPAISSSKAASPPCRSAGRRRHQIRCRGDALPAAAELHARPADARPEEPAECRRVALVPTRFRRPSAHPRMGIPARQPAPLALNEKKPTSAVARELASLRDRCSLARRKKSLLAALAFHDGIEVRLAGGASAASVEHGALLDQQRHVVQVAIDVR